MSRPAPRRHRAARLLALTSGPSPTAEETVDVRPKPELFSSLLLTQRGRGVRYSHVYFSRFYEPGARLAFARPTTPSKPVRPHGNAAVRDQRAVRIIPLRPSPYSAGLEVAPVGARSAAVQRPPEHDARSDNRDDERDRHDDLQPERIADDEISASHVGSRATVRSSDELMHRSITLLGRTRRQEPRAVM